MKRAIFSKARCYGLYAMVAILSAGCGGLGLKTGAGGDAVLNSADAEIVKSYAIEELDIKENLLAGVQLRLKKFEDECDAKKQCPARLYSTMAFYYLTLGNTREAAKYNARALEMEPSNAEAWVINARILLRDQGKAKTAEALEYLEKAGRLRPGMAFTQLSLGDCYFLKANYAGARRYYTLVLQINSGFQVEASDRLETIYQIESLKMNPAEMQNVIFARAVQRDDVADLLDRVFQVEKIAVSKNPLKADFRDINDSSHAESIRKLLSLGIYSFISGDTFAPFTMVRKKEFAKIIEDCVVLATGNVGFRSKYGAKDASPFTDVRNDDPYFNAIMLADEFKLMDSSLGGAFEPLQPVKGIDAIIIFQKLMRRFRR